MSRSQPVAGPTISLFPFLAVLLCTMGALLVLLVLFSRAAKEGEARETQAQALARQQAEEELALEKETLAWRLEQVKAIRAKTAEDLAKARMQLAGIEQNVRSLTDELTSLERKASALATADPAKQVADEEIERLEARLKSAKESLDEKRREMDTKPAAYAVVPFVGSAGTHRRPLYIECSLDGVFLQPEGIRLGPADFEGPPGPGNPLASALRAAREHIASTTGSNGDPGAQPYPLLLVRPSGVMAYYAAREAIQSWGSEFGYQLIDEDWTLSFPPRDLALADVERRAVEESRERLAWLMARKPSRAAKPATQYRAATTRGGVVSNTGPSLLGDQSQWDWSRQQAARGIVGGDGDGAGRGTGFGTGTGAGASFGTANGTGAGYGTGSGGTGSGGTGPEGAGPGGSGGAANADGGSLVARPFGGGSGAGDAEGAAVEHGGSLVATDRAGMAGPGGTGAPTDARGGVGSAADGPASSGGEAGGRYAEGSAFTGSRGQGGSPGASAGTSSSGGSGTASSLASGASGAGGAGGGGGPALPGMLQSGGASGAPSTGASGASGGSISMAGARGRNWASLATADRPVPLTRPIHVECSLDELRLFDDAARRVTTRIPLGSETADAIDPLVKAVHGRVAGWGLAGDRMYWNPQLILSETADGRSRREDIERLLIDSGLETRRKESFEGIRPLPPVQPRSAMLAPP